MSDKPFNLTNEWVGRLDANPLSPQGVYIFESFVGIIMLSKQLREKVDRAAFYPLSKARSAIMLF